MRLLAIAMLGLGMFQTARATDTTVIYKGTMTVDDGSDPQTFSDTLEETYHTDANGNLLPNHEVVETTNGNTISSTLENPVPLADGSGYTLDMSGGANGESLQYVGKFIMQGQVNGGMFTSFTYQKDIVLGSDGQEFQTGGGTVTQNSDGSYTIQRSETIVDSSGNTLATVTSSVTSDAGVNIK